MSEDVERPTLEQKKIKDHTQNALNSSKVSALSPQ